MIAVLFLAALGMVVSTQPAGANTFFTNPEAGPNLVLIPLLYSPISFLLWFMLDGASLYWLGIKQPLRLLSSSIFCTWCGYAGLLVAWIAIAPFQLIFTVDYPLAWLAAWLFFTGSFTLGKTAFSANLAIASTSTSKPASLARKLNTHLLQSAAISTFAVIWCLMKREDWFRRYLYFSEYPIDSDSATTWGTLLGSLILATAAVLIQRRSSRQPTEPDAKGQIAG